MIYTSGRHSGRGLWIRVVLPVLCMAGLLFGVVTAFRLLADAVMVNLYYDAWLWICLGSVCTAFLALALACKESAYKRKTAAEASELLAFMKNAEPDRLRRLAETNPGYFWSLLPYAYAWGVDDKWIQKFKTLEMPVPEWHQGGMNAENPVFYAVAWSLSCHLNMFLLSLPSGPGNGMSPWDAGSSSSFSGRGGVSGGGGFSGGGFGGGGGGSW